ncbi:MAG TPA: bacillithiol system redox-active protein YtxJ [Pseudogracilibacillus sp.]|nr:bacillithiol system redox-active protein YtxJ [Pseudogracilibacillus sp.]
MDWKEITTIEEWDDILNKSAEKDQVILKHSTTCPVSTNALDEYNDYLQDQPNENIDYTMVKVRESRPVSNKIEEDLNVKHESPQIIYIQNKAKYWSATHWSVTKAHMKAVID